MGEMIVSFTHSNYKIKPTGTEKFVRNLSEILKKNNYDHLNFFSFYTDPQIIGVNFNDQFRGIYRYDQMESVIEYYASKCDDKVLAFHFQHILNHRLDLLERLVKKLKVSVCIVLHDYYLICNRLKMIDTNDVFCGVTRPNWEKCKNCSNIEEGIAHFSSMKAFLTAISEYIYSIIAPSEYVFEGFGDVYPELRDKVFVRPHLKLCGNSEYQNVGSKIKLAYVGAQMKEKGFDDWKILVAEIRKKCPESFELFYFGTGKEVLDGVTNVYVSTSEQGENAMIENLRNYGVDCAFVWPNWAETYSYVYYELALCGAYVVSNKISGNIYSEIISKDNGRVFEEIDSAIDWFLKPTEVRRQIDCYRQNGMFRPEKSLINAELELFVPPGQGVILSRGKSRLKINILKTLLYRVKYNKYHL